MAHLAAMHLQGIGASKKDVNKAIQWYTKAAELGLVRAQAVLAVRRRGCGDARERKSHRCHR